MLISYKKGHKMIHNWENYFDISSEYWKKAERIYEENESFPKKVVKDRNLHHKFPRSFSKKDGVDVDNDNDNLVSLSLADHFRVHYYLWKCAKKGYRGMMAKAFIFMRKKAVAYATDETIEQLAKDYEEAMKEAAEANKGKHPSEETRKKISEANKGKRHSEETRNKMSESRKGKHPSKETRKKLSESNKGKPRSAETRKKLSEAHKGKTSPNKGKHPSEETRNKISEAKKGKHTGSDNPFYGKRHSEETRRKISEAFKGCHWYNNGKINKLCYECPEGFIPGRIK